MIRHTLSSIERKYVSNNKSFFKLLEKDFIIEDLKRLTFKKGSKIESYITEKKIFYIRKGVIMRSFNDYEGNKKSLDVLVKDEVLGLSTLSGEIPVVWEIEVLEDVELVVIPSFILERYAKELYYIFAVYSQYYLTVVYISWQAMLSEGAERINYALLFLVEKLGLDEYKGYTFPEYVNHNFIASFSAVSRSYVTRHIAVLEKKGVVSVRDRKLYILDVEKLKMLTPNYRTE
ncbi:Crp/Fnr family transcriptional regulator [Enterococcus faecalis]|uniref:Crp/Fnr family transcriptional regulator n=1 Tax=Enterococcus sp. DIV1537a TaxID=2774733 RepID=UPI003B869EB6